MAIKNKKTKKLKTFGVVDKSAVSYENHPYFIKKAEEAKEYLKKVGLPKKFSHIKL